MIHKITSICAIVLLSLAGARLSAAETVKAISPAKVVIIPIREQIAKPELFILRRGLKEAIERNVDTIVLDMETPGGALDVTFEMLKALEKFPGKTVTYINKEAISAGALISAGTDEIYFAPGSIIGAAAPVQSDGREIDATMREKIVSYLKARVRSISEGKGYRGDVISAMIDINSEMKIGDKVIKPKGELLSLTAQEAMQVYGDPAVPLLGSGIADNMDVLLDKIHGAGNYSVKRLEITWSEKLAQYLTSLTPILLGLGLLALFIEFKAPGFGIFGITGICLLGVVFFSQFVAGLSGHEPILFFLLGVILIAIEIFFVPGSLVFGLPGAALILGSLVWAMTDIWPGEAIPISSGIFARPLMNVMVGVILAAALFLGIFKFLPQGGIWGKMVLNAAVAYQTDGARALAGNELIGQTGVTLTPLFPTGQVEIGGRCYEARLATGFAEIGTSVKVVDVVEFSLKVEVLS